MKHQHQHGSEQGLITFHQWEVSQDVHPAANLSISDQGIVKLDRHTRVPAGEERQNIVSSLAEDGSERVDEIKDERYSVMRKTGQAADQPFYSLTLPRSSQRPGHDFYTYHIYECPLLKHCHDTGLLPFWRLMVFTDMPVLCSG
jgi:hypothetical protein